MIELRRMDESDVTAVGTVWRSAWRAVEEARGETPEPVTDLQIARSERRYRYLLGTDPEGAVVASAEGTIIGYAMGHVRGDLYVLANLAVAPDRQSGGVGHQLLERALGYARGTTRQLIFSSSDPRAIHRYLSAGFAMSPAVDVVGQPRSDAPEPVLRRSSADARDLSFIDTVNGPVHDAPFLVETGNELWIDDDGAYAFVFDDRIFRFGAVDETTGRRTLAALFDGSGVGRPLGAGWLTATHQWALLAATDARASISGHGGSVMRRGTWGPEPAYLPNGLFG